MDGRSRLSGAAYRKKTEEKRQRESKILQKIPRLDSYFSGKNKSEQCRPENSGEITVENSKDNVEVENLEVQEQATLSTEVDFSVSIPSNDPFYWENTDHTRDYLIKNGINQNNDADFSQSSRRYGGTQRFCSKKLFQRVLVNGEIINREYLVYSPSQGSLFCAPCKLFGGTSQFATSGFNDWSHAGIRVAEHENSASHRDCLLKLKSRGNEMNRIDKRLLSQHEHEVTYWRNVLKRVVSVVKKLASRGLAFRGDEEKFGSVKNGNFMMCLELIAEYDSFLADHIARFGNPGKGSTSYLSPPTYEELMLLMGKSVSEKIGNEVISSKYFSVIVDSTPDLSHNDQLSVVVRYVTDCGLSVERFLCFMKNTGHTGQKVFEKLMNSLEQHGLKVDNCRGQSYDNAANMSGMYSGLQARLKERNPLVYFIPCAAHSLNLVGSQAVKCCNAAVRFFELLQSLYNYFADSTGRWNILENFFDSVSMTLKSLSTTRWTAREDACKSLDADWKAVVSALRSISENERGKGRCQAEGLLRKLNSIEVAFMTSVWGSIFQQFGKVMKKLQAQDMDISTVIELYDSLTVYLTELQACFPNHRDSSEKKLNQIRSQESVPSSSAVEVSRPKRQVKRRRFFDESSESEAEPESPEEELGSDVLEHDEIWRQMEISYSKIIQTLQTELQKRVNVYKEYNLMFSFLSNITKLEAPQIYDAAEKLRAIYDSDIESSFGEECIHFKSYLLSMKKEDGNKLSSLPFLCRMLASKEISDVYPNVYTALKIYNCTPATNCSAERSFSVLKRIKNYLRTGQNQVRLVSLGVLAIESDITVSLDFEEVINSFATAKVRRKSFF